MKKDEHLVYNAAVIMCVDGAWIMQSITRLTEIYGKNCDLHTIPGAAKDFHNGNGEFAHTLINNVVKVSMGLHRVPRIILLNHWNCGAYGGSQTLASTEEEIYRKDLLQAKSFLAIEVASCRDSLLEGTDISDKQRTGIKSYGASIPEIVCFYWQPSGIEGGYDLVEI